MLKIKDYFNNFFKSKAGDKGDRGSLGPIGLKGSDGGEGMMGVPGEVFFDNLYGCRLNFFLLNLAWT